MSALLKIEDLKVAVGATPVLNGVSLDVRPRRSARDHGPERLGQEHPGARARRPSRLHRDRRQRELRGSRPARACRPRSARARVSFLGFQYPVEIPGVNNVYLLKAAYNAHAQAPRPARSRCLRVPRTRAREDEVHAHGRGLPQPRASMKDSRAARRSATRSCRC